MEAEVNSELAYYIKHVLAALLDIFLPFFFMCVPDTCETKTAIHSIQMLKVNVETWKHLMVVETLHLETLW